MGGAVRYYSWRKKRPGPFPEREGYTPPKEEKKEGVVLTNRRRKTLSAKGKKSAAGIDESERRGKGNVFLLREKGSACVREWGEELLC